MKGTSMQHIMRAVAYALRSSLPNGGRPSDTFTVSGQYANGFVIKGPDDNGDEAMWHVKIEKVDY